MKQQFKKLNLSDEFMEHFCGLMLGDGSLTNKRKSPKSSSLSVSSIHIDYIQYLSTIFELENIEYKIIQKKGGFENSKMAFEIETKFYPIFSELEKVWYQYDNAGKRRKTIPQELCLSKNSLLQWYIGDGYVVNHNEKPQRIMFCTDRYNEQELQNIMNKLSDFCGGMVVQLADRNRIRIPKKQMHIFLENIHFSPVKSFEYKWKPLHVI